MKHVFANDVADTIVGALQRHGKDIRSENNASVSVVCTSQRDAALPHSANDANDANDFSYFNRFRARAGGLKNRKNRWHRWHRWQVVGVMQ